MQARTLSAEEITAGIERLASAIREKTADKPLALVGIRSRGDEVAERVLNLLNSEDRGAIGQRLTCWSTRMKPAPMPKATLRSAPC